MIFLKFIKPVNIHFSLKSSVFSLFMLNFYRNCYEIGKNSNFCGKNCTKKGLIGYLILFFLIQIPILTAQNVEQEAIEKQNLDNNLENNSGFSSDVKTFITIDEIKAVLDEKFTTYETYQASLKELFQGKLRQGKIFIKKPYQIRLTYFVKNEVEMDVFGGEKTLYIHLPQYGIVYEQDLIDTDSTELYSIKASSLEFLFENYNFNFSETESLVPILDEESASLFNVTVLPEPNTYALELKAKDITRGLDIMKIWVEPNGLIKRSRTESIDKKVVDIYFYDVQLDEPIPEGTFEFVFDPSVKILKNTLR